VVRVFSDAQEGVVTGQNPEAGREVASGTQVRINVSRGIENIPVPDVVNRPLADAQRLLEDAGFRVESTEQPSEDVPEGAVVSQTPQANVEAARNSIVRLVVSSGPEQPEVPNVINQSEGAARAAVEGAGLQVGTVGFQSSTTIPEGNVIDQDPAPGTAVERGSAVNLLISSGPEEVAVPDVVTLTADEAVATLEDAGLRANVVAVDTVNPGEDGRVIAQAPTAGSSAVAGDRVRVNVGRLIGAPPVTDTLPVTTG
jgi:serine/threonine-protein kinase